MAPRTQLVLAALTAMLLSGSALAQTAEQTNAKPTVMDKVKSTVESVTGIRSQRSIQICDTSSMRWAHSIPSRSPS